MLTLDFPPLSFYFSLMFLLISLIFEPKNARLNCENSENHSKTAKSFIRSPRYRSAN
ncbi:hypothetical protein LINPERPRIM_LOCUS29389 [Linum perenne]